MLFAHNLNLARLQRWLKARGTRDIPDAPGTWGDIFAELYRVLREETRMRETVRKDLDLFVQAVEALPDGVAMLDRADQLLWCNRTAQDHLGLRGEPDYGLRVTNLVRAPRLAEFITRAQP